MDKVKSVVRSVGNGNIKTFSKVLNILYVLIAILFVLDSLTKFEIKNQFLKSFVYMGLLIGAPLILIGNLFIFKRKYQKLLALFFPVMTIIFILIVGPLKILFSSSAWDTQTILYQNRNLSFNRIEYQMQDVGSFGYNCRTVEVLYITRFFMIVDAVPNDIDKNVKWAKVNKDINQLNLR